MPYLPRYRPQTSSKSFLNKSWTPNNKPNMLYTKPLERVEVRLILGPSQLPLTNTRSSSSRGIPNQRKPPKPLTPISTICSNSNTLFQANPKLATQKDDDDRLPIHWAVSYNHLPIVELLVSRRDFDPDVQVLFFLSKGIFQYMCLCANAGLSRLDTIDDCFEPTRRR